MLHGTGNSLSGGAVAGIVIAGIVIFIAGICLVAIYYRWQKMRKAMSLPYPDSVQVSNLVLKIHFCNCRHLQTGFLFSYPNFAFLTHICAPIHAVMHASKFTYYSTVNGYLITSFEVILISSFVCEENGTFSLVQLALVLQAQ